MEIYKKLNKFYVEARAENMNYILTLEYDNIADEDKMKKTLTKAIRQLVKENMGEIIKKEISNESN